MIGAPENLVLRCPDCKKKLGEIPYYQEATHVCRRTCRCGSKWFLRAVPNSILGGKGLAAVLNWSRLNESPRQRLRIKQQRRGISSPDKGANRMKLVLSLSGGMDSTVLLYLLRSEGHEVLPISFNYGQRHATELEYAASLCGFLRIPHMVVDIRALSSVLGGSSLTDLGIPVPHGHYEAPSMKATVVPNRNMILLSVAAAYAITQEADAIAIGAHAGDHAVYPDCRPEFHAAMRASLKLCDYKPLQLHTTFISRTKADIARIGHELDVPFSMTWSCYEGGKIHCGKCGTCVERREAFGLAGLVDPTRYAR